jgi:ubiquinone/menaquinone biosynthesis C-methylase UbiE
VGDAGPDRWFFDLWARFYDLEVVQGLTYRPVHDAVLRALRRSRSRRLLDVGCGTGLLGARIRAELGDTALVGCDFSRGMLREAARRAPALPWVQGDALHLPFRDGSFDAVLSTESFHWFPDPPAALAEFHRVLAPGGRAFIALVNPPAEGLAQLAGTASRWLGEPLHWPTRRRMRERLETAGFHVESQRRVFRVPMGLLLPPVLTVAVRTREPLGSAARLP